MNVNAGHERTSKARIIHQIQLIRGITVAFSFIDAQQNPPHPEGGVFRQASHLTSNDDYSSL
ncbi:hypothetical protein [Shigella dysenteriae]|nr:hypothetical protein [Shigella dysenteriae]WNT50351.1 hypothetical protein PWP84_18710 [Shigella dysenteriae]